MDSGLFSDSTLGPPPAAIDSLVRDIRDATAEDLFGFDGVVHLAGLCNDPLGDIDPALTEAINNVAAVRLASLARDAGVRRFIFASTCSVYGAGGEGICDEGSPCRPLTAYARAKLAAEAGILALGGGRFEPVVLRCATAFGFCGRMRFDLVVNNLTAWAVATRRVHLKSDGSAWRPLIHVRDIARAIMGVLGAPPDRVAGRVLNVCAEDGNHRVIDVARRVEALVAGARIEFEDRACHDSRDYRVDGRRLREVLPSLAGSISVDEGIIEMRDAFFGHGLEVGDFEGPRFRRVDHLLSLRASGGVDRAFRPRAVPGLSP